MAVLGLRFCARAFSSCGKRGPLFITVRGPLHCRGLSCCGAQAPDAQAQQLWLTGLVAPRHVGSSQTRARTRVPCISRQILNHCATREAPVNFLKNCWVVFQSCCTFLHSYQRCMRGLIAPHLYQHWLVSNYFLNKLLKLLLKQPSFFKPHLHLQLQRYLILESLWRRGKCVL